MSILHYILIALEVVLIFNLIIGVHELGHFLAARWRGLKVERFAIWFGKPIWKKKIGGVEYALGTIPFGGYVSLPQMASMEAIEGKTETTEPLPNVSPLDKIIVAFAGPLFSLLLAVAFAVIVWQVGKPVSATGNSTVIGFVDPNGPAAKAGLRPGDNILEVDGHPVSQFSPAEGGKSSSAQDSVKWCIITSQGTNIAIKYQRDGQVAMAYPVPIHQPTKWYERRSLRQIMIDGAFPALIAGTLTNSPAEQAGLMPGDEIVAMDGQRIYSPRALWTLEDEMTNGSTHPVTVTVHRSTNDVDITLLAARPVQPTNAPPSFGIVWQVDTNITLAHPRPLEQIQSSAETIFATFAALFAPHGEIGVQQLGGAVMIFRVYYNLFQDDDGWRRVLWFSVVLNVNLALLNMLPLPVLDGGHITLSLIEVVRRRPVSARILEKIQSGFAALLIAFMLYIAFFDAGDWIRSAHSDREVTPIFAPQK